VTAPRTSTDSLASVANELATLFEPLRTELDPARARIFFLKLGLTLSDAQVASLATPIDTIVSRSDELIALIPEIIAALDAEQWDTAIQKSLEATNKIEAVIAAFDALATALQALAIPNAGGLALRLFDALLAQYLEAVHGLNDALEFLGLLDREDFNVDSTDPAQPPFTISTYHFGAIGDWLSNPASKAQSLYGWGPGFDGQLLFPRLERLATFTGLPVFYDDAASPRRLDVVFFEIVPTTSGEPGVSIKVKTLVGSGTLSIPAGPDATVDVNAEFEVPVDTELSIRTDGTVTFTPPTVTSLAGAVSAKLILRRDPPEPFVMFGQAGGSRVEFTDFSIGTTAQLQSTGGTSTGDLDLSATLNGGKVVIDTRQGDGFLAKILPGTFIEADFSTVVGISTERGFYFSGSSALEVRLPAHIPLGPISIEALTLAAALDDGRIPASLGADVRALLGPIEAVVQNMGVTATLSFPPNNSGNLGPAQFDIGFKPPTGAGLRVAAGPSTGGGFLSFDSAKGEYVGALELSFKGLVTLKAIGIINTKLPDGSRGFALLILITAEFTPIQLGFGFTLLGVGGLLGLNRSLDTEALRLGVRTGSVANVLFPPDVIGNIVQIVSDLKSFFPIAQGHFVVAPMGKLGWGTPTLISIELGVILDIPSPQLNVIGVLRCLLPTVDAPILKLQVNFAGGIDFERGCIWFDASLFDSSLLEFTLSGDMAARIGWGDEKVLVASVGGFHPAFHEVPSDLTGLRRITLALLSGSNPKITAELYFAITSNTVQSGARVELYAGAAGFNIYGFLGYDLLVQFLPFHFVADLEAKLALRRGTSVIAGIHVSCELSGPTPWRAHGHGSFSILFFSISIGFDVTWGFDVPSLPDILVDVLSLVVGAVDDIRNWRAIRPSNAQQTVSVRQVDDLLLHPFGVLEVSQKIAPLGLPIDKFGNQKPSGDTTFTVAWTGGVSDSATEEFAVANFVTMSDSEKLSRKSFESMKSGLRFSDGDSAATGAGVARDVTYEMSYLNRKVATPGGRFDLFKSLFDTMSLGNATLRNPLSVSSRKRGNGPAGVQVDVGDFRVVRVDDLAVLGANAAGQTEAEAFALRDALVGADPSLAGTLQVMTSHELLIEAA
jgi:hypothetical protein